MANSQTPNLANFTSSDEYLYISPEGLNKLTQIYDPKNPDRHTQWETDYSVELPIRMKKQGAGSETPITLIDAFQNILKTKANKPALRAKRDGKWLDHTFQQFYDESKQFANGCIALGLTEMKSVNIMGFNSPEWLISFYGSIFGHYLPVGIYTTNGPDACQYVASHSDAEMIVVENQDILNRFLQVWNQLPQLKYIVVYGYGLEKTLQVPEQYKSRVLLWKDLLELGKKYKATKQQDQLEYRMSLQKPGNCCTLVYTSGTTGNPKGVMLSHDNYVWTCQQSLGQYYDMFGLKEEERIVSYLPLSHVAAQIVDIISCIIAGVTIWFAEPTALQGTLVNTLQEARPTFFLGVPRVWEKIEEKMKFIASTNGFVKKSIADWAKAQGRDGSFQQVNGQNPTFCFNLAKKIVFDNVKYALGLDQARVLMTGAAPLATTTRDYFLSLNMVIVNAYGMSESSGPQTLSDPRNFSVFDMAYLKSAGVKLDGTDLKIVNPDKDGNGEICYKGRNRFMGYYKNEQATKDTIDKDGYLHSGDVGQLDKKGNLAITGRIKELIITAGGENIAPVLIENEIKTQLSCVSQVMVVGEQRKYLIALLTIKMELDKNGQPTNKVAQESCKVLENLGITSLDSVQSLRNDPKFQKLVQAGIDTANSKAISKAHHIRKWAILDQDFSVEAGELTPTLKLKRNVAQDKHKAIIETLYLDANL